MSKRAKIIILTTIILAVLGGIIAVWRLKGTPTIKPAVINEPEIKADAGGFPDGTAANPLPEVKLDESGRLEITLKQQAADFAERFGSYSAASSLENIAQLKPVMTEEMQKWADGYAAKLWEETAGDFRVTTRIMNGNVIIFNQEKEIKVLFSTQREDGQRKITYQDIEIDLAKEGGEWKVSKAEWR